MPRINKNEIFEEDVSEKPPLQETSSSLIRHPEQLDELLVVVNSPFWILLGGIFSVLLLVVAWAFFGSMPIKATGKGIFMGLDGGYTIQAKQEGIIKNLRAGPNMLVKKGDLLAEISNPEEELKLQLSEIKLTSYTQHLEQLKDEIAREEKAVKGGIESDIKSKEYTIKQKEQNLAAAEADLEKKSGLFKEGLISAIVLREQEGKVRQSLIEIETIKAEVENLKASLLKGYRSTELKEKTDELFKVKEEHDLIAKGLEFANIYAPADGSILEVFVSEGDKVTPGQAIIWLEYPLSKDNPLIVYGYLPAEKGKTINRGQKVEIYPSEGHLKGVNYIEGKVISISEFPISSENLLRTFHNKALSDYLTSGAKAVNLVLIEPNFDFNYTDKSMETLSRSYSGELNEVQVIYNRVRPIFYLLPIEQFVQK